MPFLKYLISNILFPSHLCDVFPKSQLKFIRLVQGFYSNKSGLVCFLIGLSLYERWLILDYSQKLTKTILPKDWSKSLITIYQLRFYLQIYLRVLI